MSYLCLRQILLGVRFVVLFLHEWNPAQLAFLDKGLDVHGAQGIAADPLLILQDKAVVWAECQKPSH